MQNKEDIKILSGTRDIGNHERVWVCLQFVIVVFPDHTYILFLVQNWVHTAPVISILNKNRLQRTLGRTALLDKC